MDIMKLRIHLRNKCARCAAALLAAWLVRVKCGSSGSPRQPQVAPQCARVAVPAARCEALA